ncbi:MAG: PAS domain-containing protein [Epsilonproteobacteria bacterium]|nr:PAS domain-containing protein [Campylobacterota bacterium]
MGRLIIPRDEEIKLNPSRYILSTTDLKGNIIDVNDYFVEICKYSRDELIGSPHNIIRHPHMPKAVFYLMWKYIKSGKNITAVVKNLAKDGRYYWVITDFEIRKDIEGNINRYMAFRQAAPRKIIDTIEPLYRKLVQIEKKQGMQASLEYLSDFLEKNKIPDYNSYIKKLEKRSALTTFLMNRVKQLFG